MWVIASIMALELSHQPRRPHKNPFYMFCLPQSFHLLGNAALWERYISGTPTSILLSPPPLIVGLTPGGGGSSLAEGSCREGCAGIRSKNTLFRKRRALG